MTQLLVVESPAKAKTINKYLGNDYEVLASYGHIRDLPSKNGSVDPDKDFAMTYEIDAGSQKHILAIVAAAKQSDAVLLATDPDREGEAISWHVLEALKEKKALKAGTAVKRVTFNEITKKAIIHAVENPRDIDMNLVNAQQARRALDYLVGFTLSPVLWRKLPGSKSAGRVQSVALRAICEREEEIERFESQEYWDVAGVMNTGTGDSFKARLTHLDGYKLEKFSLPNETEATKAKAAVEAASLQVKSLEKKEVQRHPSAPFITSSLQMEAARKLGFSAKRTMQVAQGLYEGVDLGGETVGLITYMRTDGVTLSNDAVQSLRGHIQSEYGDSYLPKSPRMYKSKAKNAQEAHEAIRPTDITRTPADLKRVLNDDQWKLYDLIWKRTLACQMASAVVDQTTAIIGDAHENVVLRATGSVIKFAGFLTLYQEGKDDNDSDEDADDNSKLLPDLKEGEALNATDVEAAQHFTEPPPRYTEASLVKKLEELGIGRPSTYASIISVLQDRQYVSLDKRRFTAEARGRIVNAFLVNYFERYVEYDFTAKLEDQLDEISEGNLDWKKVLHDWWKTFIKTVDDAKELKGADILTKLDAQLSSFIFGTPEDGKDARACPSCSNGRLGLKLGRFGAFLGCSNYPECGYTRPIAADTPEGEDSAAQSGGTPEDNNKVLGTDPKTGDDVWLKKGPYGWYVQLGEAKKPKRASLPKGRRPEDTTLDDAVSWLALPREIGKHPETGEMISAGIGRYGPYLLHNKKFTNIPEGDDVMTIGINRAVDILAKAPEKKGRGAKKAPAKKAPAKKAAAKKPAAKKTTAKKTTTKKKA